MIKLYPSRIAFSKGEVLDCEYNSQCQRYQIFMKDKKEEIDPKYMVVGAKWEDVVQERLDKEGAKYEKELPMKLQLTDDILISGRLDYLAEGIILECKGSLSKKFLADVIQRGTVKLSHLAQVATYFLLTGKDKAKLLTGYFMEGKEGLELKAERAFKVKLDDKGSIIINKTPSGYDMNDLITGIKLVGEALNNDDLMERPTGAYSWQSVCKYCKFNVACTAYEAGASKLEVLESTKELK